MRVDRAVAMLAGVSRSAAAELVADGRVRVDGRPVGRAASLRGGAHLVVELSVADDGRPVPDPSVPFSLVYEDDQLLVVDKPAGVVVHPGAGHRQGTLVSGLLARYPDLAAAGDPQRPGIVQRLDKGTSGLMVVARTPAAHRSLVAQLAARTVGRRYLSLVAGHLSAERGVVEAPLGRSVRSPTKMAVTAGGRAARTAYQVLARYQQPLPSTLLVLALATGRTHQIRVHLSAIGHPVVGDDRYGAGTSRPSQLAPGRLFLHAAELAVDHPLSGRRLRWDSALPDDLARVIGEVPPLPEP